jgi:glycosyltransferase involved in cell wall biosynthesis
MHILILADAVDNQNAGVHTYTKNLIQALLKIDKKNKYSFIHCQKNPFFTNEDNFIIPQHKGPGTETYRRFIQIPKLINKLNPDIVLQPCHIGPFRLNKKIKRVVTIHDLTPIKFPEFHTPRGVLIHKLLLKKTLKNADLILTPSKTTKRDIIKRYKISCPISVTPLGIRTPQPSPPKPNIPQPYILFLGTIEPRKNLETLINAFLELKSQHNIPHKLVLAGPIGWKCKNIIKKAKSHPHIILTGHISESEKASLYKHVDIFVYPSIYEGFGLPPLEAMSYGIPVICSNGGSLKEYFENHALIFDPKNKIQLKQHILTLIQNPNLAKSLSEKAFTFSKSFTWENTAKKTLKAFMNC